MIVGPFFFPLFSKVVKDVAKYEHTVLTRIKDIAQFSDVRDNQLVGYGLVVGLNGSGDRNSPFTQVSFKSMLERLNVTMGSTTSLELRNVAAVMVTATLPPFSRKGSRIDVTVSAMGDATDLRGGTLLVTPLLGGHNEVVAVAQGAVSVVGLTAAGATTSKTVGTPTAGKIANGAIIEKEVGFELASLSKLRLALRNPDFTTANRVSESINNFFGKDTSHSVDHGTIDVKIPKSYKNEMVHFITQLEQLEVIPDQVARIVIDPAGVIAITNKVRLSPVAVNHGSITIRVSEKPEAFTPNYSPISFGPGGLNLLSIEGAKQGKNFDLLKKDIEKEKKQLEKDRKESLLEVDNEAPTKAKQRSINDVYDQILESINDQINDLDHASASAASGINKRRQNLSKQKEKINKEREEALNELEDSPSSKKKKEKINKIYDLALDNLDQKNDQSIEEKNNDFYGIRDGMAILPRTEANIEEKSGKFSTLDPGPTLQELVDALNALGVTPREMVHILETIKRSGALHAEILAS